MCISVCERLQSFYVISSLGIINSLFTLEDVSFHLILSLSSNLSEPFDSPRCEYLNEVFFLTENISLYYVHNK